MGKLESQKAINKRALDKIAERNVKFADKDIISYLRWCEAEEKREEKRENCEECRGAGRIECGECSGSGSVECSECGGETE